MTKNLESKALLEFKNAAGTLNNSSTQLWKGNGGRIIGHFCCSVPAELISAAGLLPVRMRATGSKETILSDQYFANNNCTFTRHCLDMGLQGAYRDFLDGVVWVNSCTHLSRLYDIWNRKIDMPYLYFLSLVKKSGDAQVRHYRDQLIAFKKSLEKHFDVIITNEKIHQAIRSHNESRELQRQFYEIRKKDRPPITGAEALAVTVAGTVMERERFNKLLRELIDEICDLEVDGEYRPRLMIIGSHLDDPSFIEIVESQGAIIVTDAICFGTKNFAVSVNEDTKDPMHALARYYIQEKLSCPPMFGDQSKRFETIKKMAEDHHVDGVIIERMLFCEGWAAEMYMLGNDLMEANIPVLKMEREYLLGGMGQISTRVQAFLETIHEIRRERNGE